MPPATPRRSPIAPIAVNQRTAARMLGMPATVLRHIPFERLPHYSQGQQVMYRVEALHDYALAQEATTLRARRATAGMARHRKPPRTVERDASRTVTRDAPSRDAPSRDAPSGNAYRVDQ